MTTWFVTRHPGALEWVRRLGYDVTHVEQFDIEMTKPGDSVMGNLPVSVIARLTANRVQFFNLDMKTPPSHRGRDLTPDQMDEFGAQLVEYTAKRIENDN